MLKYSCTTYRFASNSSFLICLYSNNEAVNLVAFERTLSFVHRAGRNHFRISSQETLLLVDVAALALPYKEGEGALSPSNSAGFFGGGGGVGGGRQGNLERTRHT